MNSREELFELAGHFPEDECHHLEEVAENGTDDEVYALLYEAEEKISARSYNENL